MLMWVCVCVCLCISMRVSGQFYIKFGMSSVLSHGAGSGLCATVIVYTTIFDLMATCEGNPTALEQTPDKTVALPLRWEAAEKDLTHCFTWTEQTIWGISPTNGLRPLLDPRMNHPQKQQTGANYCKQCMTRRRNQGHRHAATAPHCPAALSRPGVSGHFMLKRDKEGKRWIGKELGAWSEGGGRGGRGRGVRGLKSTFTPTLLF